MNFAYRLDMALDLFEMTLEGEAVVMNQDELDRARSAMEEVKACWSDPTPGQLWAAISGAIGRDPRADSKD